MRKWLVSRKKMLLIRGSTDQRVGSGSVRLTLSPSSANPSTNTPSGGSPAGRRAPSPSIRVHVERRTSDALLSLPVTVVKAARHGIRRPLVVFVFLGTVLAFFILVVAPQGASQLEATRYGTPVVHRTVMEKLRLLELHFGADEQADDYRAQLAADVDASSPEAVVDIPDVAKADPLAAPRKPKVKASEIDEIVCGGPCSFLVPAWLGEQETKAQQHLYQLGLLAMALNRTLVLPNVQKSRMATCQSLPFSFYYDADSLANLGIPTLSQAGFSEWAERRDPPPSAQVVSVVNAHKRHLEGAVEVDTSSDSTLVPNKPQRRLCLSPPKGACRFENYSPLSLYPPAGYHKNDITRTTFGESLVKTIKSTDVIRRSSRLSDRAQSGVPPDVLALNYELRFPVFTPRSLQSIDPDLAVLPFEHFPYAPTWTDLAESISLSLGKFVAVHWRTETLAPAQLGPCAQALVKRLARLHREHPDITTIYLATDYPLEDADRPHSGTFKAISAEHHAAFKLFLKQVRKQLPMLRLTTLAQEARSLSLSDSLSTALAGFIVPRADSEDDTLQDSGRNVELDLAEVDTGLVGIVDKSICMTAPVFLSGFTGEQLPSTTTTTTTTNGGNTGQCAKVSSFTRQIVDKRWASFEDGVGGLVNVVGHFSQDNKWDD